MLSRRPLQIVGVTAKGCVGLSLVRLRWWASRPAPSTSSDGEKGRASYLAQNASTRGPGASPPGLSADCIETLLRRGESRQNWTVTVAAHTPALSQTVI